jgi:CheY-like chemotaxis protein
MALLAFEIVDREPIDVVILDYRMPGMDGGRVAQELRRRHPKVEIIMSSGLEEMPQSLLTIVHGIIPKGTSSALKKKPNES